LALGSQIVFFPWARVIFFGTHPVIVDLNARLDGMRA
jgi:hypothetical protein